MDAEPQTAADEPAVEPLTDRQRAFAAALPDVERSEFQAMSSQDRDELVDVMQWAGQPLAEGAAVAYERARADLAAARARAARPGGYWPRNAQTAPTSRAELDRLEREDDKAVDAALRALEALLAKASGQDDLQRRSRMLSRLDRGLADPKRGYLRQLRELRTTTLALRHADVKDDDGNIVKHGIPARVLAAEAGVSARRIKMLLNANKPYESSEMRDAKARLRAQRAARAAAGKAIRDGQKEADLKQGAAWAARVLAGERVQQIAEQEGVRWQLVAGRIRAAQRAQSAAAEAA